MSPTEREREDMSETKTDAQILRDAAAHIRKVGKTSGIYFGQIDEDGHWLIDRPCALHWASSSLAVLNG